MNMKLQPEGRLNPGLNGLGGWLILVQAGLYFSLVRTLYYIFKYIIPIWGDWDILTNEDYMFYHRLWAPLITFETVYNVILVLFLVFILVNFYMKKSIVPRLMIILYSVNLLAVIIDYAMLQQIPFTEQLDDGDSRRALTQSISAAAIWIPYFLISKRVKQTFIR